MREQDIMDLQVELAPSHKSGLRLKNPVMLASGPSGYGVEYGRLAEMQRLGALICKGTSLYVRKQPQPEVRETPAGLLHNLGWQNPGVRVVIDRYAPQWENWEIPVLVNLLASEVEDLRDLAELLDGVAGIAGFELYAVAFWSQKISSREYLDLIFSAIKTLRRAAPLPLVVKLSANPGNLPEIAIAVVEAGADALSLIGPIEGKSIDLRARQLSQPGVLGGISGPAIKPIAVHHLIEVARALRKTYPSVPIVGGGGITNAEDALEFIMAGATAIQVGSIAMTNPRAGVEILEGIEAFLQREGVARISDLVGVAL